MPTTVPSLSILFMMLSLLGIVALPITLVVLLRRRGAAILPFLVGCIVWPVFALLLEGAVNRAVLLSSFGATITGNLTLYALFGGLMAGLFEETGRLLASRTLLRKHTGHANALMYGAGHGCIEAVVLLGLTMITNLTYAFMINGGQMEAVLATIPAEQQGTFLTTCQVMMLTPPSTFLVGLLERLLAVALHMALSVLVFSARGKRWWLFPLAIFFHALVNFDAVMLAGNGVTTLLVEAGVAILTLPPWLIALRLMTQKDA